MLKPKRNHKFSTNQTNSLAKAESQPTLERSCGDEAIAIVGIGCRFPGGVDDAESYWRLLEAGTDAIQEIPSSRWSSDKYYLPNATRPGKTQSRWGGFLADIDRFDPQLFGISPREAAGMDPQQRMMLEVTWRAIEDAGIGVEQLAGQSVVVFVGISSIDYAVANLSHQDRGVVDAYSNTGSSSSIAANRISYCFDLRGPSVAVDTACSSSLVAVHAACESIWRGDCPLALAGGVNALLLPDFYVAFSQLGVLSPDGRCKTFDARANGYVRGEGAGMVLLKPLRAALQDQDRIYAVVRATAVNQDGRTPGLTVPSQAAQEALLRTACKRAGIRPAEIQYVEAHGTGTPVGDPIEANALGAVLSEGRDPRQPCLIGSVKTNIGHLEAGAGIASLIKVALALHHRRIPSHLHFEQPHPAIDFDSLRLQVATRSRDWISQGQARIAGINGFGYGGANAHVIVQEAPTNNLRLPSPSSRGARTTQRFASGQLNSRPFQPPVLLPISARSQSALATLASNLSDWLDTAGKSFSLDEIAAFAAHRRSHLEHRAAVCGHQTAELAEQLRAIGQRMNSATNNDSQFDVRSDARKTVVGRALLPVANPQTGKSALPTLTTAINSPLLSAEQVTKGCVFVCSGQGPQWWAMGRQLLHHSPVFRQVIQQCDQEFKRHGQWSLMEELDRDQAFSRLQKTSIAQPSIFAVQVALAELWRSWGIEPTALVGHSVGEIAAAHLAGALDWEDACRVAFYRGKSMDQATSRGGMLAVGLPAHELQQWLAGLDGSLSLAAINGPSSVTVSGANSAIESLADRLERAGLFCKRLAVEYAFHSPHVDPAREHLLEALHVIRPRATHTRLVSTVTGASIDGALLDANYWWGNVREPVRFAKAMHELASDGFAVAIELGAHPVLAYSVNECFQAARQSVHCLPSLQRDREDFTSLLQSLGELYTIGFDVRWPNLYSKPGQPIDLPKYPFQHQPLWTESRESRLSRTQDRVHPLLGESQHAPVPRWHGRIDLKLQSYLRDHRVRGACVFPAAAILEIAIAAARQIQSAGEVELNRVVLRNPCILSENQPIWIETAYCSDRRQIEVACREIDGQPWTRLATLVARMAIEPLPSSLESVATVRGRCHESFDQRRCYEYCKSLGLEYGPAFRGILGGWRREGESLVEIELDLSADCEAQRYCFHPALLDSCFHSMIVADKDFDHTLSGLYLPTEIGEVRYLRKPTDRLTVCTKIIHKTHQQMLADMFIFNADGQLCMIVRGFESQRMHGGKTSQTVEDLVYSYQWVRQDCCRAVESPELGAEGAARPARQAGRTDAGFTESQQLACCDIAADESRWLVFTDNGTVGQRLIAELRKNCDSVVAVQHGTEFNRLEKNTFSVDPENRRSFQDLLVQLQSESSDPPNRIVYLWGLDVPRSSDLTADSLQASTVLTTLAPLHLVQAWQSILPSARAHFAIVTSGAQPAADARESVSIAQSPLIGFGRVVSSEFDRFRTQLVDLSPDASDAAVAHLLEELKFRSPEDEVQWRHGLRWVHRFHLHSEQPVTSDSVQPPAYQLRTGPAAAIEDLRFKTKPRRAPGPDEVEIEVVATGLNFSDVMKALDLYPGIPGEEFSLGAECCGRIVSVGVKVTSWQVGDEVIAIAPGAFSSHVTVDSELIARKPSCLTCEQAAAIPIAFLTAQYALHECARIREGEDVLIHAASGGVGLAAIQLAKLAGARVFTTAGSDEKRAYLSNLGVELVMDSRSLRFVDQTRSATQGRGVDAVLNSLPGEAIGKGLALLKTGGRFLEIGKRDIYSDSSLGMYVLRNNLSLFAIDLDQLFREQPRRMGNLLRSLVTEFERGTLQPPPVTAFDAPDVASAFRRMQQSKHIGKISVRMAEHPVEVYPGSFAPIGFSPHATYWIAGGLGGFGIEIARWMVEHGARHLVLSSRSKSPTPQASALLEELASRGAQATAFPADITSPEEVQCVLDWIDANLPPLRGVFHAAMVLEDRLLADLDRATLERVLSPKVLGGWNLHECTRNRYLGNRQLDHFVLFSSLASIFGHAGQANYSAANSLLDGLAHYRRSQGLPALVVNWGHLGEVGYLAQRPQLGERLERQGVLKFTVRQATDALEYALQTQARQLSVLRMDWSIWQGLSTTNRVSPRFAHLLSNQNNSCTREQQPLASLEQLRGASPAERLAMVDRLLRFKASTLLGIPCESIDSKAALIELGLDSLMSVEMRNWIEHQLQIDLPVSDLMRGASLNKLAATLCADLDEPSQGSLQSREAMDNMPPTQPAPITSQQAESLLNNFVNLGDQQVSDLLSQLLREQGK